MSDLTTRLLAEIERREADAERARTVNAAFHHPEDVIDIPAYLTALRGIVGLHRAVDTDRGPICASCAVRCYPCTTVVAVARALGIDGDSDCRPPASTESDERPSDGYRDHPHGLETGEAT